MRLLEGLLIGDIKPGAGEQLGRLWARAIPPPGPADRLGDLVLDARPGVQQRNGGDQFTQPLEGQRGHLMARGLGGVRHRQEGKNMSGHRDRTEQDAH